MARYDDIATRVFPGAAVEAVERLTGGVSADVHRLDLRLQDGSRTRVVLRAHGATHSGHPAELEYALLRALHAEGVPVPEPLLLDTSGERLPHPYLVMTFVEGTTRVPDVHADQAIDVMADLLARIHALPTEGLPTLPVRNDPLPEVFDFLPEGAEWEELRAHLRTREDTAYTGTPMLQHGDFWPENLLWRDGAVAGLLDWEEAALGDPLCDVAVTRVELRYRYGTEGMNRFTEAYAQHRALDDERLALWDVYVSAAAQRYMGEWGLPEERVAHMRRAALANIRDAGAVLLGRALPRDGSSAGREDR